MANRKDVYYIKPPAKEGQKAFWLKIGVAWENKDGSLNLKLDVPVIPGMDVQLREPTEREDKFE